MVDNVCPYAVVKWRDYVVYDWGAMHVMNCGYMRLASNRLRRIHRDVGWVRRGGDGREHGGVRSVVSERLPNPCERALALDKRYRVVAAAGVYEELLERLRVVCRERPVVLSDKLLVWIIFDCRAVPSAVRKRPLLI